MAKAQLKILVFLITVGLVAGSLSVGYWFYMNVLLKESQVERDIAAMKGTDRPRIDPGARRFEAAVELIRENKIEEGREALSKLRLQFPESATCPEAMRIIGEINLDRLFSPNYRTGKKDYIVQPGDSLNLIASKQDTTVASIIRMNNLMSTTLHPGDHLIIVPMEFNLGASVSKKQVMLLRKVDGKDYLFKVYNAKDIRLPAGTRFPAEISVVGKNAYYDGKPVGPTDSNYNDADKSIPCSRPGVVIRTPPVPKALAVNEKTAAPGTDVTIAPPPPESGIFLSREDIEELFALVNKGATMSLVR